MNTFFSPDSKFMQAMTLGADLLILNLLFLVTALPVVTIGPAVAALYSVVFSMGTEREKSTVMSYFRAFRANFALALKIWLLILGVGLLVGLDMLLVSNLSGILGWSFSVFGCLLLLELLGAAMVFPLISLFGNTVLGTIKNALILGIGQFPRAAVIAAIWCFPVIVLFRMPMVFFYSGFLWAAIFFSGAAYLSSRLLKPIFAPYLPEENEEDAQ